MSFEVQNTSLVWVFISFSGLMKCLSIISLNTSFMLLLSISALSVLVTLRFGLLIVRLNPEILAHVLMHFCPYWCLRSDFSSLVLHPVFFLLLGWLRLFCSIWIWFKIQLPFCLVHPFALLAILLGFPSILLTFSSSLLASLTIPSAEFISKKNGPQQCADHEHVNVAKMM